MKVLWLINGPVKEIANHANIKSGNDIGWVASVLEEIKKYDDIKLYLMFPQRIRKEIVVGDIQNIRYYGVYQEETCPWKQSKNIREKFEHLLEQVNPDIIHIWGTEFAHSLDMIEVVSDKNKIVVHIQGLISVYSEQYMADLPYFVRNRYTFRDFIRRDNLKKGRDNYRKRGKNEISMLREIKYVMGRTDWDYAHSLKINSGLTYFHCKESMRREFFEHKWSYSNVKPYTIFITQGNYPIKGLHYLLDAVVLLKKEFPEIRVRVAGENIICQGKKIIRESSYGKYIRKYIKKYGLKENIEFIGNQDITGMIKEYLQTNVFVIPSALENSPNSLAEAMVLGVPTVSSCVGGVASMVKDGEDCLLYQHNDPTMLAYYIRSLFIDSELANSLSTKAMLRAREDYDASKNIHRLRSIYSVIMEEEKNEKNA